MLTTDSGEFKMENEVEKQYIDLVLEYDQKIARELEMNMNEICDQMGITIDEIKRSQTKYINNRNSHRLLGADETLEAKIP